MEKETEQWVSVKGFEGFYEISNLGNVRSLDRYVQRTPNNPELKSFRRGMNLKLGFDTDGYYKVNLVRPGVRKTKHVHKLVALHFIDNPDNLSEINHIKPPKTNNRVDNLEWCTSKDNKIHQHTTMKLNYGANKLNFEIAQSIRQERKDGATISFLAEKYGVVRTSIKNILNNKNYSV